MEFTPFPKMARLSRECIITEKIDGTNAQILIGPEDDDETDVVAYHDGLVMRAGSRAKWVMPGKTTDNHGWAQWVADNNVDLFKLGIGNHFGEWWGQGIQRKYDLTEKRFSLFNTIRWCAHDAEPALIPSADPTAAPKSQQRVPACCHVVPLLYRGMFDTAMAGSILEQLREQGSLAAPGFFKPEGIVVFHIAGGFGFKKTLDKDEVPKGLA